MSNNKSNSRMSFEKGQVKNTTNKARLIAFVEQSEYIAKSEQPIICKRFNLPYLKGVFANEYRKRFYNYLYYTTTTTADVFKQTKIPEKFLCQAKAYYEKKGLLQVLFSGRCPVTKSKNVNFLSTNKKLFSDNYNIK
ncbi:hypothetical protein [Polaribacter sp. IC073]|uniref:hypothetical protein n=1 Tax=Polaribacter sp. IC073 TaxID=2508540 RepID=UPI0011BEB259|nr:hypothetical protein [Polaribacter sp. IC073]TXD47728.1 hypothetical protein ES045_10595 [Polaribacter sp. IC073]